MNRESENEFIDQPQGARTPRAPVGVSVNTARFPIRSNVIQSYHKLFHENETMGYTAIKIALIPWSVDCVLNADDNPADPVEKNEVVEEHEESAPAEFRYRLAAPWDFNPPKTLKLVVEDSSATSVVGVVDSTTKGVDRFSLNPISLSGKQSIRLGRVIVELVVVTS
ncbi:hypothetical protein T265_00183 [Opisthorchis viverrini]|uniref:Uncharacterized protein n=1 Tax=Opisthorchis viverrini TaxID=6198 RepID=A0A075A2N6_OPIVI|nr:hypothetical protein T265_00183 [Opisthorchis viverrini]KER33978.1 hypothetical protein T265_00183 [Opisthorchis viverrini]